MTTRVDAWRELSSLIGGFRLSQVIGVLAELRVTDALVGGPRTAAALAEELGAEPDALRRLLRAAAAGGLLTEEGDRFGLTPVGAGLRSGVPGSQRDQALLYTSPPMWAAWGALSHSVRTGGNAFKHVHGEDVWSWRAREPEAAAVFDRAMASMSRLVGPVLETCELGRFQQLVDVGGGQGVLLARALVRHPQLRGVLFERPGVVDVSTLVAAGVEDRCRVVEGSFFDGLPAGDAILLKHVLHNWEDGPAARLLQEVRRALTPGGRVFIVERCLEGPGRGLDLKLMDLHMLVSPGGRERTHDELAALLAGAELHVLRTTDTPSGAVIEAG